MTSSFLTARFDASNRKLAQFASALEGQVAPDRAEILGDGTCIYVVGSGGREEIGTYSDLDVFLVSQTEPTRIQEILLQASVIRALRATGFPDPDGGGRFLQLHHAPRLVDQLGAPTDDTENTFTARMLLLLESKPLLGHGAYEALVDTCLDAYWKNTREGRAYLPMVLVNDIVRYWRIVLLNYESRHAQDIRKECAKHPDESFAAVEKRLQPKKWAKGIKLRFARCMSCFSVIAALLAEVVAHGSVARSNAREILRKTPLQRLADVRTWSLTRADGDQGDVGEVAAIITELETLYASFLEVGDREKNGIEMLMRHEDASEGKQLFKAADRFAQRYFDLLQELGKGNPLFRYLVV